MNYREQQLRQIIKKDYVPKSKFQELVKTNQALTLLAEKRKEDLTREKKALFALARQKLATKKEASELLNSLEEK
jgi:hypothetical protein